ncbi:hypothetical protein PR048_028991, partial [Dryococelus australis]
MPHNVCGLMPSVKKVPNFPYNTYTLIDEQTDTSHLINWKQWKEIEDCPKLIETEGSVEALNDLHLQLTVFKKYVYVKRAQSQAFKDSAMSQDEIQCTHWNHKQITVFTACAWVKGATCCFTIVSNDLSHDKNFNLNVKNFPDGCASQFKNKFTLSNLCFMPKDFGVEFDWFCFATSHGKSAVDGIGLSKCAVWNRVKQRKCVLECAVAAASSAVL